jgi:hypothetical protein
VGERSIYDPLGIEIFAIDETFESLFNGLKGVYFRLYFKESQRPAGVLNIDRCNAFFKRYKEVSKIKRTYRYNDWLNKRKAVNDFSPEFKQMIDLELTEYKTIC